MIRDACCRHSSPVRARKDSSVVPVRCHPGILGSIQDHMATGNLLVLDCSASRKAIDPGVAPSCCLRQAMKLTYHFSRHRDPSCATHVSVGR